MQIIRLNIHKQEMYKNSSGWNEKIVFHKKISIWVNHHHYSKNIKEKGKLLKDMKENFENQDIQILETKMVV